MPLLLPNELDTGGAQNAPPNVRHQPRAQPDSWMPRLDDPFSAVCHHSSVCGLTARGQSRRGCGARQRRTASPCLQTGRRGLV
jgi:hypothetical protein